ncbi:MAG: putative acyltransferase [Bacteroidetes bacterium]|nr:putative acyltransferase [Bacteroidota bacterium]
MTEIRVKKERVTWIDFAKVISITLVVLGHVPIPIDSPLIEAFRSFRMPLFFFLAGCLAKDRSIKEQTQNIAKTLLIPYILLYIICYVLWLPLIFPNHPNFGVGFTFDNIFLKPFLGLILGNGYHTGSSSMVNLALWFLAALMVVKMIHAVLLYICKGNNWVYFSCVSVLVLLFLLFNKALKIDLFFSIDSALLSFPFYAVGNRLSNVLLKKPSNSSSKLRIIASLFIGLSIFLLVLNTAPLNGYVDIDHCFYGQSLGLFYLIGFLGILALVLLSQWYIWKWSIISTIANGTIIILAFHGWVTKIILIGIGLGQNRITPNSTIGSVTAILVSVATVVVMVPLIIVADKWFPILMGRRKLQIATKCK